MQFDSIGKFLRSPQFPIFMIIFVDVLGLGITIPVLPLFAQNQLGASAMQITILTSIFFTAQFFAAPLLGRLSDRLGRRPVLIVSQIGTLTALLMNALAPTMLFLSLSRVIDGITGGNITVAQAYLSDVTDETQRTRSMGLISAAFSLGFIFGPAFGGLLAAQFGPRVPFFAAAGFSLATILLSTFMLSESLTPEQRRRDHAAAQLAPRRSQWDLLRVPAIALILLVAFGTQFSFFSFQTIYVLWAEELIFPGASQAFVTQAIALILTLLGIVGVITQAWLVGPLVKRFGEVNLVNAGNVMRALAFASLALFPVLTSLLAMIPFMAIGGGIALPSLVALLTFAAPPNARGGVIGLNQSANALGSILGPLLAGFMFDALGPNAPMVAAASIMGATVLVGLNLYRFPLARPDSAAVIKDRR
ncbi:MAG: tetracycline resistance MFS efflux pump [Chloroflexota bacterium]|nr:MAG: tetracycline resistance MFS efflux pump [Chloroflexota bacterium]